MYSFDTFVSNTKTITQEDAISACIQKDGDLVDVSIRTDQAASDEDLFCLHACVYLCAK